MLDNQYAVYFDDLRLQINPEAIAITQDGDNKKYNILGTGEVTVPRIPKPRKATIRSYFPAKENPWVIVDGSFQPPEEYIDFFRDALKRKKTMQFSLVRINQQGEAYTETDDGFKCLVEAFSVEEKGGETGDFYFELSIVEYRSYSPTLVQVVSTLGAVEATAEPSRPVPAGQLVVGAIVIANGRYYYTSYGEEPFGTASGRRAVVSRIVDDPAREYPIHINGESGGALGWCKASILEVVG